MRPQYVCPVRWGPKKAVIVVPRVRTDAWEQWRIRKMSRLESRALRWHTDAHVYSGSRYKSEQDTIVTFSNGWWCFLLRPSFFCGANSSFIQRCFITFNIFRRRKIDESATTLHSLRVHGACIEVAGTGFLVSALQSSYGLWELPVAQINKQTDDK